MINLKEYNTYKIDTSALFLYEPHNIEELIKLLEKLNKSKTQYFILGGGSNVLLPDKSFNGAIIRLKFNTLEIKDNLAYVDAGYNLTSFIKKLIDLGYTNLAPLYGIPGTIGGAIHGNAGLGKTEIFTYLESVLIYQNKGIKLVNAKLIEHSYRYATFSKDTIILGGVFKLVKGSCSRAWNMINKQLEKRKNTQPLEYPSAGSVFKNPKGTYAGLLIEECGLKGYQMGGAMVSDKHANFIINLGNATSSDIVNLINLIKDTVKKEKGIELELEQKIVKW